MKPMPHNDEAERGVLSCCLQDFTLIGDCIEKIGSSVVFYDLRRERIYRMLEALYKTGKIDFLIVRNHLKQEKLLDSIGGDNGLSQLQDYAPSTAGLGNYLEILQNCATHRKLIQVCAEGLELARGGKLDDVLPTIEKLIMEVRPETRNSQDAPSLVCAALENVERLWASKGAITGLSTGLTDLDQATNGLGSGEMTIISGYPSTGKTSLAMNIAEHNFLQGIPVGVLSAEMLPQKLVERSIYTVAEVNRRDIQLGLCSEADFAKINAVSVRISKSPIHIENASGITIGQAQAMARRLKQRHGIKLLIMDYLQIFSGDKSDSRELEVKSVGDGAKRIAMELNIPVILLSQLNDDGLIRESRAPLQTADGHWRLENDGEWEPKSQPIKLLIQKGRDSEAGTKIDLLFQKTVTKFRNAAKVKPEDVPKNYQDNY